jgi:hypothetical protein
MKAMWDLEEKSFMLVKATARLPTPFLKILMVYCGEDTYSSLTSWMYTPFALFSRIFRSSLPGSSRSLIRYM